MSNQTKLEVLKKAWAKAYEIQQDLLEAGIDDAELVADVAVKKLFRLKCIEEKRTPSSPTPDVFQTLANAIMP